MLAGSMITLLKNMSKSLGYDIEINIYSPQAHELLGLYQAAIREGLLKILNGDKSIKVQFVQDQGSKDI